MIIHQVARRPRAWRALQGALEPGRCVVLNRLERARRAALWLGLGASLAAALLAWHERRFAEPARLAPPVLEHSGARLDVYRFDLEWRFARFSCRLIVHRDTQTWSVTC